MSEQFDEQTGDKKIDLTKNIKSFKCNTCGSLMYFSPEEKVLRCESCDNTMPLPTLMQANELKFDKRFCTDTKSMQMEYVCSSCGAHILLEGELAHNCPFCGASNVVHDVSGDQYPNAILPFGINKENALTIFRKWIKNRYFAPNKFRNETKARNLNGVYIPCWTFDANIVGTYSGVLGERYTTTVGTGKNRTTVTRVRWYHVSGKINRGFDDVLIEDSNKVNTKELNKLGGFDTVESIGYDAALLAGYSAESYNEGRDKCYDQAKKLMLDTVREEIIAEYGADEVDKLDLNVDFYAPTYKYVLCPVWISSFRYNKKDYGILINGRSGKAIGKAPLSPLKVGLTAVLGAGVLSLAIYLVYLFMYGV